jgi:ATP-binding cassette subfamily B multidrug efflux pump
MTTSTDTSKEFIQRDQVRAKLSFGDTFRFLWIFTRGYRFQFFACTALVFCGGILGALAASKFGKLIETLVQPESNVTTLQLITLAGFEMFSITFIFFGRRGLSTTALHAIYNLRARLFTQMKLLPMSYYDREPQGRIVTRLTHDVDVLETFYSGTLARLLSVFLTATTVIIVMLQNTWWLGTIAALLTLPSITIVWIFKDHSHELYRRYSRTSSAITARLAEFLNGMTVIRSFGLENWTKKRFEERADDFIKASNDINWFNSWMRSGTLFLTQFPTLFIFLTGSILYSKGTLALGVLVAYIRLSDRLARPAGALMMEIHQIQSATASTERLSTFLTESVEQSLKTGVEHPKAFRLKGNLNFENVFMKYNPNSSSWVLENFNLKIEAGQRIGIMGRTGSGKSTLISLITRLYPYQAGAITMDRTPIEDFDLMELRSQIAFVSQSTYMMPGSVRDNLSLGVEMPDEHIWNACRRTGLDELLKQSGRDLGSFVQAQGSNFSQGEAQLFALTRALIQDPAVIVLDEATASLDPELEDKVQAAIEQVAQGSTCIFIAHRLRTLVRCERVIILQNGKLVSEIRGQELKNPSADILLHLEA